MQQRNSLKILPESELEELISSYFRISDFAHFIAISLKSVY